MSRRGPTRSLEHAGVDPALMFAVVLATLAATDAPLVAAGVRGRGADGIVQPWRWPAYLGWLAIRLLLVLAVVVAPSSG